MQERDAIVRPCLVRSHLFRTRRRMQGARWRVIGLAMVASVGAALALTSGCNAHASNAAVGHVQPAGMRIAGPHTPGIAPYKVGPCGTLNVWTPDQIRLPKHKHRPARAQHPVLLWIADDERTYTRTNYGGAHLARKGVVVVTLPFEQATGQCRTSPSSERSGSLREQLSALQWVNRNIATFGGDPARVTIVGVGSGAGDAQALLTSAPARPLFQQIAAFDGQLLREHVGQVAHVPVLLGVSRQPDRGPRAAHTPFVAAPTLAAAATAQSKERATYAQWLLSEFGAMARDAALVYPSTHPASAYLLAMHDRRQTYGMLHWADLQTNAEAPVFLTVASVPAAAADTRQQVDRGAWPALLMNNPAALVSMPDAALRTLADTLSDYLVAFAMHGDPAVAGRPNWPAYDTGIRNYLELSGNVHTARDPLPDVLELHRQRSEAAWQP